MKKILHLVFVASLVIYGISFTACDKDDDDNDSNTSVPVNPAPDTTPPVITINGADTVTVSLNSSYTDAGATAVDNVNGAVTVTSDASSTNPNVNLAGTYIITYNASDTAGNQATATRTIVVRNDAYYLEGSYITTEGFMNWTQTITASVTVNNRIHFSKFANYSNNNQIYVIINGSQVDITTQNGVGIGLSGCTHTFTPNGTGSAITTSPTTFSIKFTDQQLSGGAGCPATGAVPVEDFFVKQ